ncbi:hypothetical protein HBN50_01635 [Halobacteriovorax sp. GB3]|uniref:hypothetical protein n=1 Tax=Halobacteriovorax sp. GB3 TaxID=2719615 RepID=UPI00236005C9|nr:hypothetical protein [Halobacteriovorax sp. GB3]MDD0851771.1 hypothetical protein [Halobacteriovorax sp. GB3]
MKVLAPILLFIFASVFNVLTLAEDINKNETTFITDKKELLKDDHRLLKTSDDSHLDAIGRIQVIFKDYRYKKCSSTLIALRPGESSDIVQTVKHCFDNEKSSLLLVKWESTLASGKIIKRTATVLQSALHSDLLLLKLDRPISFKKIRPILIPPESFEAREILSDFTSESIVAGYSSDRLKGQKGSILTYTRNERAPFTLKTFLDSHYLESVTYKGASGGAFIVKADLSKRDKTVKNPYSQYYYLGTIKGGISLNLSEDRRIFFNSMGSLGSDKTRIIPLGQASIEFPYHDLF